MPTERPNAFFLMGTGLTLAGDAVQVGSPARDFEVISTEFQPLTLASSAGKTRILLSVPSLDTSVCDREAKEFSTRAGEIPGVEIVVVSVDLPGALKRWCGSEGIDNLVLGSDHRDLSFGLAYGVVVKELRQLSRAAFVVDAAGTVTYVEYVRDMGDLPDFDAVIRAARSAAGTPA